MTEDFRERVRDVYAQNIHGNDKERERLNAEMWAEIAARLISIDEKMGKQSTIEQGFTVQRMTLNPPPQNPFVSMRKESKNA